MPRISTILFTVAALTAALILGLNYEAAKDAADYASLGELWFPAVVAGIGAVVRFGLKS